MATHVLTITTTEDLGAPKLSGTGALPLEGLRTYANFLSGVANGSKFGTIDAQKDGGTGTAASGTVTAAAVQSGDTVTINGTALTATQHNARATATFSTIVAGNVVTIAGKAFTARVSPSGEFEFALGASDTEAATNLAAKINACTDAAVSGVVTATSSGAVVTIRAVAAGTGGNAITLTKTGAPVAVTGSGFLTGGTALANNTFDFGGSDTQTGAALAAAILASNTALVSGQVTAANASGVVTLTALTKGTVGNMTTLASSDGTRLAVTGARLTGGANAASNSIAF